MITVYTITYNEEVILPYFITWYRNRFPDCRIIIYDNYSTDNTEKIALEHNCEVIKYDSNNEINDELYLKIKNNCWKTATTDWVVIVDADEFLDISKELLENTSYTVIKAKGYEMCGEKEDHIENINKGVESSGYGKKACFNKKFISEINYHPGCHDASPKGEIRLGVDIVPLYHFKWLSKEYVLKRYALFKTRLSKINKKNGWGAQYNFSEQIQSDYYNSLLKNRKKLF